MAFHPKTSVKTSRGEVSLEDLQRGDLVMTMDSGYQPVQWCGPLDRTCSDFIFIGKDAFARSQPERGLLVTRSHRLHWSLLGCPKSVLDKEIFIPAWRLSSFPGCESISCTMGHRIYDICLPRHEVIFANGLPVEHSYVGTEITEADQGAAGLPDHRKFILNRPLPEETARKCMADSLPQVTGAPYEWRKGGQLTVAAVGKEW
ncbi:Hint domain-containing protein [Pseudooceanicola algae]|uniref:Hedgehog/Intein (Hint) domain-containing protein n=1 Tax=Pseudooceanicola algae TaxID=1537215 RepID=A0A418SJ21_9RHOB|nr:hypothetical protein PSAL_032480 [Pseudooceanicola algae]